MNVNKSAVGQRIKNIRQAQGLTMEEFGKLIDGAQKSNVSKWENGKSLPSSLRLKIIADIGHVSVDELLHGNIRDALQEIIDFARYLDDERFNFIQTYPTRVPENTVSDFLDYFEKKQERSLNKPLLAKVLSIWDFLYNTGIVFSDLSKLDEYPPDSAERKEVYRKLSKKALKENERYLINTVEKKALDMGISPNQENILVSELEHEAEKLFTEITRDSHGIFNLVNNDLSDLEDNVYDFTHDNIKRQNGSIVTVRNDNISQDLETEIINILDEALHKLDNLENTQ